MAGEFNPPVQPGQDNSPNYFKFSEPIKGVTADQSSGIALKTAGEGVEGFASLAKSTADNFIKEDTRATIEPIQRQFISDLQTAKDAVVPPPASTAAGNIVDIGDPSNPVATIPSGLQRGVNQLQSIHEGYVQGHYNDTYYTMRLDSALTSLRSKYEGFRDVVDAEQSKITGINPANATITNVLQDLNATRSAKKTEQDKILDLARGAMSKGFDKANLMFQRLQSDPSFAPQFMQWYTDENAKDTALARDTANIQNQNLKGDQSVKAWKNNFSDFTGTKIGSDLNATAILTGMDKPSSIMGIISDANNNPGKYTSAQMEQLATQIQTHMNQMRVQLKTQANQKGYNQKITDSDIDNTIASQTAVYQNMYDAIKGGGAAGAGLAFAQANHYRAVVDQTKDNLTNTDLGKAALNYKALSDEFGPALTATTLTRAFLAAQKNVQDRLKPLLNQGQIEAAAQPGGPDKPITLAQHITNYTNDPRITKEDRAALMGGMVQTVTRISDPNVPDAAKANFAKYFFDPSNNGVLNNWKPDYRTTSPDGRLQIFHPGKQDVFNQLTSKEVTDNIAKMDEQTRANYRSWVDVNGRELIGQDVRNLNHFTGHDNLYFDWDSKSHQLTLRDKEGALASPVGQDARTYTQRPPDEGYVNQVKQAVEHINKVIPNLEHVYSKLGGSDVNGMLLQTLQQYGLDNLGKISGLPKSMGDAIAASRKAPAPEPKP